MAARLGIFSFVLFGIAACSSPDWVGDAPALDAKPTAKKGADAEGEDSCDEEATGSGDDKPGIDVDVSELAGCCEEYGGKAHCVPDEKISSGLQSSLDSCSGGGLCVPDPLIAGKAPAACDSGFGDGVCISLCVKAVAAEKESLSQSTCSANEVCAPCIHPIEGKPTGVCDIGKSPQTTTTKKSSEDCAKKKSAASAPAEPAPAPTGPAPSGGFPSCCGGKGSCVPADKVPEDQRENLEQKECSSTQLCAPTENIPKDFVPKACTGESLTGDYEGVCLSNCIAFDLLATLASEQGSCDGDHRCIPCKTPFGTDSGAPGCK